MAAVFAEMEAAEAELKEALQLGQLDADGALPPLSPTASEQGSLSGWADYGFEFGVVEVDSPNGKIAVPRFPPLIVIEELRSGALST